MRWASGNEKQVAVSTEVGDSALRIRRYKEEEEVDVGGRDAAFVGGRTKKAGEKYWGNDKKQNVPAREGVESGRDRRKR